MGNKDEWPAENDYVSRLTKQFLTVLTSQLAKNVIRRGEIKYVKEKQTKAAIIAISDTKGQRNEQ